MVHPFADKPTSEPIGGAHCTHCFLAAPMLGDRHASHEAERLSRLTEKFAAISVPVACTGRVLDAVTWPCVVSPQRLHNRRSRHPIEEILR